MKKLNLVLDLGIQFLIACLAALVVLAFLKPQSPPAIVAVDLDGYVNQLQKDWQTGKIDENRLKKTLSRVRRAIAIIPLVCPNTIVLDDKAILADDSIIHVDAEDLQSLDDLSPNEQRLYLESILRCKR